MFRPAAMMALIVPLALSSLAAAPALAQSGAARSGPAQAGPSQWWPTRDVAVTYNARGGRGAARSVPTAWLAAERRLRVEPPEAPGWVLVDVPRGQALMVMDQARMAMRLPEEQKLPLIQGPPPGTTVTPAGSATVAGHRCDNWRLSGPEGQGTVCLTADGVLLRAQGSHEGQEGTLEATSVAYARQDPARFRLPPDYRSMTLPPGLLKNLPPGLAQSIPGLSR